MPINQAIALSDLLIDVENPRIETSLENQREAIRAVAIQQGGKLAALAKDILEYGLNPSEIPIVMPYAGNDGRYVVLEGNRRITALKVLENPELIDGEVGDTTFKRIRTLSNTYHGNPIDTLNCIVVADRPEANHWIELRHTGENEGAGLVRWGGAETARFRRRSGQKSPALQVLDYLEQRGDIDTETRQRVPVTSLGRVLSTPHVRTKLGIDLRSGTIETRFDDAGVARGLKRVVEDLASGNIKTEDIYARDDRIRYIDNLPEEELPDISSPDDDFRPLGTDAVSQDQGPRTTSKKQRKGSTSGKSRTTLIPRGFTLSIKTPRINEIYQELRKLEIEEFSNAVSVLFRVFLELSVDAYNSKNGLGISEMDPLNSKVLAVARDLESEGKLERKQVIPVERATQKDTFLATNIYTMHQYVHNPYFSPVPSDLRAMWDNLSVFIEAIWS